MPPGQIQHEWKAVGYVTDIMPTILEIAGVDYATEFVGRSIEPMRGRSMSGLLDGTGGVAVHSSHFESHGL